jgi:class 3 adenylate cyclase
LVGIGLGQYADAFAANDIDMDLLKEVDDQTLKEIGMASAGHRLRLRNAIAKLTLTSDVEPNVSGAVPALEVGAASAERRQLTVMFCDLVGSTSLFGQARSRRPTKHHQRISSLLRRIGRAKRRFCRQIHGRRAALLFRLSPGARA